MVRFGVDEYVETGHIARAFWVRLGWLAANFLIVAVLSIFWYSPVADWLRLPTEAYWLVIAHFAVTAFWIHIQMSLQGAKMLATQGLLMMIERLLIVAGVAAFLATANLSVTSAMLCYIVGPAAMIVVGLIILRPLIVWRISEGRAFAREMFTFSAPLLITAIVGYASSVYVDALFISDRLSTRDLGVYSVATQINGVFLQIPTLANTLLLPLFVTLSREDRTGELKKFFDRILPSLTLLWGMACTVFAFAAAFAVPVLFKAEFAASVVPLWVLIVSTAVALPSLLGYQAFAHSISATYISLWAVTAAAVVKVALNFALVSEIGIVGAAWSTVAACGVAVVVSGILLRRRIAIGLGRTLAAMLPALTGGLIVWLTNDLWWGLGSAFAVGLLLLFWLRHAVREVMQFFSLRLAGQFGGTR
jgi:O-antigen/teichoic acid export membrane protein